MSLESRGTSENGGTHIVVYIVESGYPAEHRKVSQFAREGVVLLLILRALAAAGCEEEIVR